MHPPLIATVNYTWGMTDLRTDLSRTLILAMESAGLNGKELAALSGASEAHISQIRTMKGNPTLRTIETIFGALGVTLTFSTDGLAPTVAELAILARECSPEVLQLAKTMMRQSAELERRQQA